MNPLSLILGFLPLIAFNLLAGRVPTTESGGEPLLPWPLR
jgi:hypothetical protein